MATFKELGNKAFSEKDYPKAVEHFSDAIKESPSDHTLYSNRSASYLNMGKAQLALSDADRCIEIKADWDRGHQRRAMALQNLGRFDDAIATFEQGLKLNPENAQIKQGLDQCRKEKAAAGTDDAGGMFGPEAMVKLMSNPRIAGYFQDPKFRNSFELCKKDPQMLMQIIQIDPRFMDVFKELTGIDLMDMQSQQMKAKDKQEDFRKKNEELAAKKRAEDEARKKQEEEEKLSPEEKDKIARMKQAEVLKNEGNEFYKREQFAEALKKYDEALQLDENEITYINNKATAYFEMKDYEKCIEECDKAIQKSKEGYYDYVKLGKALARKAGAMAAQG